MVDKTIPHYPVLMVSQTPRAYPRHSLPEGYSFTGYRPGDEDAWARLIFSVGESESLEAARQAFSEEFLVRRELLPRRCQLILDPSGRVVGTATLWMGSHFGPEYSRVHWVSVAGDQQGKGLAKALLTRLLDIHNQMNLPPFVYLTSATWNYRALNLYEIFGFRPYLGDCPPGWKAEDYARRNPEAWELIRQKTGQYRK